MANIFFIRIVIVKILIFQNANLFCFRTTTMVTLYRFGELQKLFRLPCFHIKYLTPSLLHEIHIFRTLFRR